MGEHSHNQVPCGKNIVRANLDETSDSMIPDAGRGRLVAKARMAERHGPGLNRNVPITHARCDDAHVHGARGGRTSLCACVCCWWQNEPSDLGTFVGRCVGIELCVPASRPKSQLNGFERAAESLRSALQLVAEVFPKSFPLQGESVPEMVPIAWPKSHRKGFHCAAQAIPK